MQNRWSLFLLAGACALRAQSRIEDVPPTWQGPQEEQLLIASAEASAFLSGQYRPEHICDGDRGTKWVAPTRPSVATPQWVSLTLAGGALEVSSAAVFGEATNNDGILDAEIQVETKGAFRTVASVTNAHSGNWLARFEPVRTPKVRLLVTRSGGPTGHTDVYEVELYGRPLSPAELKTQFAGRLSNLSRQLQAVEDALRAYGAKLPEPPASFQNALRPLQSGFSELQHDLQRWDILDARARQVALQNSATMAATAQRLESRIRLAAETNQRAFSALAEARKERARLASSAPAPGMVAADFNAAGAKLANERLLLSVNPRDGKWTVVWAENTGVAVCEVGFEAEAGGVKAASGQPVTSVRPFQDALGKGQEVLQVWETNRVRVERELRVYDGLSAVTLGGRITNKGEKDIRLGTVELMEPGSGGWWWLGHAREVPASVFIAGQSLLRSVPFNPDGELSAASERTYQSSGVVALVSREPAAALTIGYVRAEEASPQVWAHFRSNQGGDALSARSQFLGRVLGAGETVELNRLYVSGDSDPFQSLEAYGHAMARFSARPARTGPTGLWCSWYGHRMDVSEEKVLANAEVAARHFKPLGLEIMQLDHGWQRNDVTGDWVPNERFPHGLAWLAGQLRERHGLGLGVWIAPTDVAETSSVFKQHPEWMLKGDDGKPRVNWRWYWKPNPNCYELDVTQPAAYQHVVDAFRQLTDWGVSYYKIDFIASSGGEQFTQHEPRATRGWTNLRRAMEAVRAGAGESAWIRYCQPPPIMSAGLANSAYGGSDTLDAGIPGRFDVLEEAAGALAAGYWLNDRPYHREVCDMSVRMQAGVEEARIRAALMTLANCSISWSDELCYLPPSRIRLMQQCLPPGNPPMKPLDLFDRSIPSVWHIPVKGATEKWDVVGLFNFTTHAEPRVVQFDQLGLDPAKDYAVFEFWEEKFIGVTNGAVALLLPPQSSRIIAIRKATGAPQLVGTDMHVLQGYHEIKALAWDAKRGTLSGIFHRMPGISGKAFFYVPEGYTPRFDFPLSPASARLTHIAGPLWMQELQFAAEDFSWSIPFEMPKKP